MNRLLILLIALALVAPSFAVPNEPPSDLSAELLADGLVSLDGAGVPTTVCMSTRNDAAGRIELCPMTPGFGPRSVGCFTVWNSNATVLQMGCYSNQEVSLRSQCKKRACSADRTHEGVAFCCCYGALCNAFYA